MLSRSNSTANNSAQSAREYGSYDSNSYYGQIVPSGSQFSRVNSNFRASVDEPWSFGRRASSFGSARFPPQHRPPVQIIILDPQHQRDHRSNPGWRGPPTRPAGQPDTVSVENSLRKEFYNPISSKRITNTINLYYRDTPVNPRDLDDGGKRCSVCLEDFERGEEVTLTPCNHMFHHDCIVPWAQTNPHCPVCRFHLGPKVPEPPSSSSMFSLNYRHYNGGGGGSGGDTNMAIPGLTTQEFLSIVRALGDGF